MNRLLPLLFLAAVCAASSLSAATRTWNSGWDGTPLDGDDIVIAGGDLVWTNGMPSNVASWVQQVGYTNTVTFETKYPGQGVFTNLIITGNCTLNNGTWTHLDNASAEVNRLHISIGGDLTLASSATIDAVGLGYHNSGPAGARGGSYYSSHGGRGRSGLQAYGSLTSPTNLGCSINTGNGGGGAIRLIVAGNSDIDGAITADGFRAGGRATSGGSVWLTTGTLSGDGTISANADGTWYGSAGGRVAVVLTSGASFGSVTMTAFGRGAAGPGSVSGAGTVYTETSGGANRTVVVDNDSQAQTTTSAQEHTTPIPTTNMPGASAWTLDRIDIRNGGILEVPATAALTLTANSITNNGTNAGSLRLNGGTFVVPATLTFPTNTTLIVDGANSITSDVTFAAGATLTHSDQPSGVAETYKMDLRVVGDLTVAAGASVDVVGRGYGTASGPSWTGGYGPAHGGVGYSTTSKSYGSIREPVNIGSSDTGGQGRGGGAVKITVSGLAVVDGVMTANGNNGAPIDNRVGPGGSIWLIASNLTGSGTIRADGVFDVRDSAGGRVAVELTGPAATIGTFLGGGGTVSAYGGTNSTHTTVAGSGTVFFDDSAGEILIIDNRDAPPASGRTTPIPATFQGNATYPAENFVFDDDISMTRVIVRDEGDVTFGDVVIMDSLTVTNGADIVLDGGYTQIVNELIIDGSNFAPGAVYQVTDLEAAEVTSDISGTGAIQVGLPQVENDPASAITVASANLNGRLIALGDGTNDLRVYWGTIDGGADPGQWTRTNGFGNIESTGPLSTNVNVIAADVMHFYRYYATNDTSQGWAAPSEHFLPGQISIAATDANASEEPPALDPGTCTVTRAATATNGALVVYYDVTGTADNGFDYETLSGVVTMQVGEATADIVVQPIFNGNFTSETVIVTLTTGRYIVAAASNATVTIANSALPGGYNVWIGSDPLDGASWSSNRVPIATDNIMLSAWSRSPLTWSASLPSTVLSWTQQAEYTGTVTVETVYSGGFSNLNVSSNLVIEGGEWTHKANGSTETYRMKATVVGDFTLGAAGRISARGKGYVNAGPAGTRVSYYSSHGGRGANGLKTYGSLAGPTNLGGAVSAGGGGAICLVVTGDSAIEGVIDANGGRPTDTARCGSGGSVWLTTASLAGSGTIEANGGGGDRTASGGRVSVVLTASNDFGNVTMTAFGIYDGDTQSGAAGTVYQETASGTRRLILDNDSHTWATVSAQETTTTIPPPDMSGGSSWTLDEIILRNRARLDVTTDTTLTLTADSITNNGATPGYLRLSGGTFTTPATLTLRTNVTMMVDGANSLTCDLTVEAGSEITHSLNPNSTAETYKMDLTVTGDLTVESNAAVHADYLGFRANKGPGGAGGYGSSHGGHGLNNSVSYGSLLAPANLGSGNDQAPGGGVVKLRVTGNTVLHGRMSADGLSTGSRIGAGGSVWLRTATLTGNGPIHADGGYYSSRPGGGGRVAVVLSAGDFSGFGGTTTAHGADGDSVVASAGTVYKSAGLGLQELIIDNDGVAPTAPRTTDIPPNFQGNATYPTNQFVFDDDLRAVSIRVQNHGVMQLTTNARARGLVIESANEGLDLGDPEDTLSVFTLSVNGTAYGSGVYTTNDWSGKPTPTNVVGDGTIIVGPTGTVIVFR